jgi:hypothetical protein
MRLWIDDLRPAPDGWLVARSSSEAIAVLGQFKDHPDALNEVSFDHDLGGDDTSRRVMTWMVENDVWPTEMVFVHTANPVGRQWLLGTARRYAPGWVDVRA